MASGLRNGGDLLADARNLSLVRLLLADPRAPVADLARGVGLSAPATRERLTRLEEAGVVRGTSWTSTRARWGCR